MSEAKKIEVIEEEIKLMRNAEKEADFNLRLAKERKAHVELRVKALYERLTNLRQGQLELIDQRPHPSAY